MQKTYLVTGGAGFIGSHLSERLVREGYRVRVLDNFSSGKIENLESVRDKVEVIRGDVRDIDLLREAMDSVEVVFHQAAIGSVPRSIADPLATHEANITGTLNVLMAARDVGVRRVVYASSSSVYGQSAQLPKREDMMPEPLSPYALSKLAGEYYCAIFHKIYGLESVSLRYFNIFGPRQDPASQYAAVIPRFIVALMGGQPPIIYGDGRQSRDFTYVENAVEANLLAAEARGVAGRAFNIACGSRYTLLELLDRLEEIIGCRLEPLHEAPRPGDIRHSQASIEAAQAALGYRVKVDFEQGLRRTVEWYKEKAAATD
jgi:UDP-glucose 4-epimerase